MCVYMNYDIYIFVCQLLEFSGQIVHLYIYIYIYICIYQLICMYVYIYTNLLNIFMNNFAIPVHSKMDNLPRKFKQLTNKWPHWKRIIGPCAMQ